jgi:hypothetical protein
MPLRGRGWLHWLLSLDHQGSGFLAGCRQFVVISPYVS